MNTKLTLKLNKRSIERAKKYAQKHNRSLSTLVEEYFDLISDKENSSDIEITPSVKELSGIISLGKNFDYNSEYGKHIEDKYGKL